MVRQRAPGASRVVVKLSEGLGMAVIEAMVACLPVGASDIHPLSKIVVKGETGVLVAPANSGRIAEAVNELLHNDSLDSACGPVGENRFVVVWCIISRGSP
jgi:glycosyltransferase involved in cell wall biosynthesis